MQSCSMQLVFIVWLKNGRTVKNCSRSQSTKSKDDVDSEVTFDEDSDRKWIQLRFKKRIGSNT